jgi:hypothetical protein
MGPTNNITSRVFSYALAYATLAGYVLALQSKEVGKTLEKINDEREKMVRELHKEQIISAEEKTKRLTELGRLEIATKESRNNNSNYEKYLEMKEKAATQEEKNRAEIWMNHYKTAKEKAEKTIEQIKQEGLDDCKKNKLISDNFSDALNSLTTEQLGALSNLLFSQIILASVISIVFIFFGDYLITRFNLETKYPRLAKIIGLRKKFQKYYLIVNITWIVICILPQIYADIIILSS